MDLINDNRLTPTMERVRSGSKQYFKQRKGGDRSSASNNPDFTELTHLDRKYNKYKNLFESY